MTLRKTFKTDPAAELEGVWADMAYNDKLEASISFKLARMSPANKQYATALERAYRPHEAQQRAGTLSPELGNSIFRRVFCDTILKDWRNVTKADFTGDENDTELVPYSAEEAFKLLTELPDLERMLIEKAQGLAAYTEATQEADAKN